MNHWQKSLLNGILSAAISITITLTVGDRDGPWNLTDVAGAAGIAAFVSGVVASAAARSPTIDDGLQAQF